MRDATAIVRKGKFRTSIRSALLLAGIAVVSATLLPFSPAVAKDWKVINFGTEAAYEPWNFMKPDGTIDGFEIDLTKDLCQRIKADCKFVATDFDGAIAALQAGKFDAFFDALGITDERRQQVDFTIPYANSPAVFEVQKSGTLTTLPGTGTVVKIDADGSGDKVGLEALRMALKGKTIGVQTATVYSKFVSDTFKDVAEIREYKTSAEHDLDLEAGRIDVALDDATAVQQALRKPEFADIVVAGPTVTGTIWGEGEAYAVAKSNPDLVKLLDGALKQALADGTVKKLSAKWFGNLDVTPR